jgi:inosine triphosphate pyrophosphatase
MIKDLTLITGNANKAEQFSKYLGIPVEHQKLDLDELQSVHLIEVIEHKAKQAYHLIKKPVVVDDVAFEIEALNGLPGPFIKFFEEVLGLEKISELVHKYDNHKVTVRMMLGFYDGKEFKAVDGFTHGIVSSKVLGEGGFGFDRIYIPEGYEKTRGEMTDEEYDETNHRRIAVKKLKEFLEEKYG